MKMQRNGWVIGYTSRSGGVGKIFIEWPEEPSKERAAICIRERLLGKDMPLIDVPIGHSEPTVLLLQAYGYEIVSIEEQPD